MKTKRYQVIGLGGTFDHFHAGHEKFLDFASNLAETLVIGVTSQSLIDHKEYPHSIESFTKRSNSVSNFCIAKKIHCEILELNDPVGTTITDNRIEALAVTTETQGGGDLINQLRTERGLDQLPLHVCELLLASDGQPLHSDRIRAGECDRKSLVYLQLFNQTITISEKQRLLLAQAQGPIVDQPSFLSTADSSPEKVILVGDSTIEKFITNNWPFQLGIFDRQIERKPVQGVTSRINPDKAIKNPAGSITPELAQSIQELLRSTSANPKYLYVQGEEDLAAIPAVMLAPLGSMVYYGQPKVGLVEICVSEKQKMNINSTIFQEIHQK